jgi:NAD(P)-dependent dehydrogenase (short-subunit alcohol dehydrogenase family)
MGHLDGRTALVTGGSRNLGAVVARHLADAGASVVVTARSSLDDAQRVRDGLANGAGQDHHVVRLDADDPEDVERAAHETLERVGGVDVLVNNAGPFSVTPFAELPTSEWRATLDANLTAAMVLARELAPGMRERGWGRVVNVSAGSAFLRNHATYGLVKAALNMLTESLALELGPEVTVNALAPGQIAESAPDVAEIDPTFVDRAIAQTPLARLVTRDEVAELVVTMVSPVFDPVTGVVVPIDGGWRLPRF